MMNETFLEAGKTEEFHQAKVISSDHDLTADVGGVDVGDVTVLGPNAFHFVTEDSGESVPRDRLYFFCICHSLPSLMMMLVMMVTMMTTMTMILDPKIFNIFISIIPKFHNYLALHKLASPKHHYW